MKQRPPAEQKAMELLLYRFRSEHELKKKLLEREYTEEETDKAIEYVKSCGYLNDRTFAEQYAASRGSSKGRAALRRELKGKGISEDIIEEVLAELPEDETETIYSLIEKRAGRPHRMEDKEYRRIFAYLARRGFSGSGIHKAMKEYNEDLTGF